MYANMSCMQVQVAMMEDGRVGGKARLYTLRSPRRLARRDDAHHSPGAKHEPEASPVSAVSPPTRPSQRYLDTISRGSLSPSA